MTITVDAEQPNRDTPVTAGTDPKSLLEAAGYEGLFQLGQIRRYRRGELIFIEGDPLPYHYIILEGAVRLYRQSLVGKSFTLSVLPPFKTFGGADLFDDSNADVSADGLIDSLLFLVDRRSFRAYVGSHPRIYAAMMLDVMERLQSMEQSLLDFAVLSSDQRLAKALLLLVDRFGLEIPLSHEDIASIIGRCREHTSNGLSNLQDSGVLQTKRHRIVVLDEKMLGRIGEGMDMEDPLHRTSLLKPQISMLNS